MEYDSGMTGDEWKRDTPYEDSQQRAQRDLGDAVTNAARAVRRFGTTMEDAAHALRSFGVVIAVADTIVKLRMCGMSDDEAEAAAKECATIAAAEGRSVAVALKALIRQRMLGES